MKNYIATTISDKTKQKFSDETKNKFAYAADKFYEKQGIQWKKPFYKVEEKTPLIPSTENLNLIIANASKKYITIFTILTEIGCDGMELSKVTQADIDRQQGIISIRGCKGHASGTYRLKSNTVEMLRVYLYEHPQEYPFPKSNVMGQVWRDTRDRTAAKLCKPELKNIPLKNLRNYSGAQNYFLFKDPIDTMRHLRHKKLETTMHYIRGIPRATESGFICKIATTPEEAADLLEQGFKEQSIFGEKHLFTKPK